MSYCFSIFNPLLVIFSHNFLEADYDLFLVLLSSGSFNSSKGSG